MMGSTMMNSSNPHRQREMVKLERLNSSSNPFMQILERITVAQLNMKYDPVE